MPHCTFCLERWLIQPLREHNASAAAAKCRWREEPESVFTPHGFAGSASTYLQRDQEIPNRATERSIPRPE